MATLDHVTGFNHGVIPSGTSGNNISSFTNDGGAVVTIDTAVVRRPGGSSLKIVNTANNFSFGLPGSAGATYGCVVCYFYMPTIFTTEVLRFRSSADVIISYDVSTNQWRQRIGGTVLASQVLLPNTWYRIEMQFNLFTGIGSFNVYLNDDNNILATASFVGSVSGSTTSVNPDFIELGSRTSVTGTIYYTDVATSMVQADFPIGPITVRGYSPNAVGTHNLDASPSSFIFKEVAAVDTALTSIETTSYQTIDDVPLSLDVDAIQVKASVAFNAISRPSTPTSAAATTLTLPTHATGDLILMWAFRSASATAPTIPAGWTQLGITTQGGSTKGWWGLYYKIAASNAEVSGTWTSATSLSAAVYRNCKTPVAGDVTVTSGVSTSMVYGANTIADTVHNWLSAFSSTASSGASTTPTGLSVPTGYTEIATRGIYDSNAVRGSNWPATTVTITSQAWGTATIDLQATTTTTQPSSAIYAEYQFADELVYSTSPLGVNAILVEKLDSATTSTWVAKLYDGVGIEDIYNTTSTVDITPTYVGKTFSSRPGVVTDNQYGVDSGVGVVLDGSVSAAGVAQSISGYSGNLLSVTMEVFKVLTPTDSITCSLVADVGGLPTGPVLDSATVSPSALSTVVGSPVIFKFANRINISAGTTYWLVFTRSGAIDTTNYYIFERQSGLYAGGTAAVLTGTPATWNTQTYDLRFQVTTGSLWTLAALNALRLRFGFTAAASGNPRLEAAMLEAAFTVAPVVYTDITTPLLVTIGERTKLFKLLNKLLGLVPQVIGVGTAYSDVNTISSVTSVQSTESTDFLDTAGTVTGTSSLTTTEVSAFLDSDTVSGVSSVSAVEVAADVEASTVASVTSLSSVETTDYVESATVASVTSLTSFEVFTPYIDRGFVTPLLITLGERIRLFKLLNDSILGETPQAGSINYTDAATISSTTSVQSSENTNFVDTSGAVNGTSSVTSSEISALVDSNTVAGVTSLSATDVVSDLDSNTIASTTAVSSVETAQYVESATITSVSSVSSLEEHSTYDISTVSSQSSVITSDIYTVVDPSTGATTTSVISLETAQYVDSGAVSSVTAVSSTDVAAYVDSSVITTITSISTVELHEIPDTGTVTGSTSVISADTAQYVDSSSLSTTTSLTYTEVAAYIDADSPTSITTPSSTEVFTQAPIPASMQVLLIKLARYHRQLKLLGSNTLAAPLPLVVYTESATIATVSSVTSTDVAAYVDSSTVAGNTTPSATDALTDLDSNTTSSSTKPSSNDIAAYVDSSTTGSVSTPSSTDFSSYVDSSLISSTTSTQPVEIFGIAEAATLSTTTTLTSGETAQYVDGDTPFVITVVSALESKGLVDTATITGITSLIYTEQFILAPTFIDAATVSTTTTLPHTYEYGPITEFKLIGTATTRWLSSGIYDRYITIAQRRFNEVMQFNGLLGSMRRRWKI